MCPEFVEVPSSAKVMKTCFKALNVQVPSSQVQTVLIRITSFPDVPLSAANVFGEFRNVRPRGSGAEGDSPDG